ncbi:hypothetical protein [Lewinella sp. JB7]|uniref:hypothetical protein n=1 Tax=Lewinella sp. JB7 TaxID=2962887 RepID=UPI0020CA09B3|nr:hypothetical protein [Lewinella sp. JB7]MCP9235187.1 hypothetical protein [Lewinella sp. JB7]
MTHFETPRPTRSTLLNRRVNRAVKAHQLGNPNGLRLASRRSALPPARRQDIGVALTGSLVVLLLTLLLVS